MENLTKDEGHSSDEGHLVEKYCVTRFHRKAASTDHNDGRPITLTATKYIRLDRLKSSSCHNNPSLWRIQGSERSLGEDGRLYRCEVMQSSTGSSGAWGPYRLVLSKCYDEGDNPGRFCNDWTSTWASAQDLTFVNRGLTERDLLESVTVKRPFLEYYNLPDNDDSMDIEENEEGWQVVELNLETSSNNASTSLGK